MFLLVLAIFSLHACQSGNIGIETPGLGLPAAPAGQASSARVTSAAPSSGLGSVTLKQTGAAPGYEITVQTPALQDSSSPHAGDFGKAVTTVIQAEVDLFKQSLKDLPSQTDSTGNFFDLKYELVSNRNNLYSLQFKINAYTQGAAHPSNRVVSFNYDLEGGKSITLEQLFINDSDYLQVISEYCKTELGKRQIGFDSQQKGADPLLENYKTWNISDKGLMITFNEYAVAASAAGPQIIMIPYEVLKAVIDPQGPLAGFVQ